MMIIVTLVTSWFTHDAMQTAVSHYSCHKHTCQSHRPAKYNFTVYRETARHCRW